MAVRPLITDEEASPRARVVFDAIRAARGTDYVNNFWRAVGHDEDLLESLWAKLSVLMGPGALDPLTKEMIYIAFSVGNGCNYCIHSHTAAARAKGLSEAQYLEMLDVIGMASQTNALANALAIPVDAAFDVK